jgi:hypothetical protein
MKIHVTAPNWQNMRTEALLVQVCEHLVVARFDHGHFLEHLGRV